MLDKWTLQLIKRPLNTCASALHKLGVHADVVSITGFCIGMLAIPCLSQQWYNAALVCILLNRILDGIDGALARLTKATDAGGFLDICLDFVFYSGVVFGFALADPINNALAGSALIFAFIGTGCTFLAFAIMAEKRNIKNIAYPNKGFFYMAGITEGTETIAFFVLFCLFPLHFSLLAWCFAILCYLTTIIRIISGYGTLKS